MTPYVEDGSKWVVKDTMVCYWINISVLAGTGNFAENRTIGRDC